MAFYDNTPLTNVNGDVFYPQTKTNSVYKPDGTPLEEILEDIQMALDGKIDDSQVLTNVPAGAKFTDTITTVNGKTGAITKADITALGIPAQDTVYVHPAGTNPHGTTKADVGLSVVENKTSATIRGEITSANVTTALGYTPLNSNLKGANSGLAELDSSGKVPSSQLPSYVDDVLEFAMLSVFPTTGETGKIYVDIATNITYRWSGTAYVEISSSLALGETSATAYRGDRGKTAYDHSQAAHAPSNAQKNSDITKAEIEAKLTGAISTHTHAADHTHSNKAILDATTASYTTAEETKLSGIAAGAEVNQNAFSNIKVGAITVAADSKTDTLELVAGTGITLVPDTTNDKITINGVNQYVLPVAGAAIGGVKSGGDVTIDANGVMSVVDDSHNHTIANVDGLQTHIDVINDVKTNALRAGLGSVLGTGVPRNADLLGGSDKTYFEGLSKVKDTGTSKNYKMVMTNGKVYLEEV